MVLLNKIENSPRRRRPSSMAPYPEPMPTYIPPMAPGLFTKTARAPTFTPPAGAISQAPTAEDVAYSPIGFEEPFAAPEDWQLQGMVTPEMRAPTAPEVSQEDDEFNRQMEEERVEADWTRMTKRTTAVLKVEADMQKARNAVAEAHQKATQRPSAEAPSEPLNRVFNRYVKGKAPMPTFEEYKVSVQAPTGEEAISPDFDLEGYILAGGQPEELKRIKDEEQYRLALEDIRPNYIAPSGLDVRTLQRQKAEERGELPAGFREGRELIRRQREHREATMAPIRARLDEISEERKRIKRAKRGPTWEEMMEHEKEVERIGAPRAPAPKEWQPKVIENVETGEQRPYVPGEPIPVGFKRPDTIERPKPSALEKKTIRPEAYHESLANAIDAVNRGANSYDVYKKLARTYPAFSAELKRILLSEESRSLMDDLLKGMIER